GTGEVGRDSHFAMWRYNVYPGGNFELHQKPFTEGAFRLRGKTKCAAAVMPYYSVSYNIDRNYGENVGNSYSKYLITDLLREQYGFDGVVCTDWYITKDHKLMNQLTDGKCWGAEHLSEAERCLKIILAGVDQFGGLNEQEPVVQAYRLGAEAYGEAFMRRRFELSAKRLLTNMFRTGLFENPYLDVEATQRIVGCPDYMRKGYEAQLKSIVMLKNKDAVLPLARKTKVYIPPLYTPGHQPWIGAYAEESWKTPMDRSLVDRYFTLVDTPEEADAPSCVLPQPDSAGTRFGNGYSTEDREQGGSGYVPISLQYRPYTAAYARETSIAGGDPLEDFTNRSYRGKTVMVNNERDLDVFLETKRAMGEKPVIAVLKTAAPMVVHEFEPAADAIVLSFGELYQAVLATLSGENEPSGLLPMQMPAHMRTVEEQCEDTPFDMECHRDAQGNVYDFAFGLNWDGVIEDARTAKYRPNGRSD
ncbi:MAG: glycoside hydrolase family 3 C-terminal domain-containing protein, partial [Clostridiales bacterium]|nr:glycoside hydrolase family 3 C-terminal domain-containing protein [Clostridiales bacterium]